MASCEHIHSTGVYCNEETGCFEAWVVKGDGVRVLVSTCSTCVSEEERHWWEQQVWGPWVRELGLQRPEAA